MLAYILAFNIPWRASSDGFSFGNQECLWKILSAMQSEHTGYLRMRISSNLFMLL